MLRKFAVPALALLALPAIASAQFEAGDYEFTISGFGSAPKSLDGGTIGVSGQLGYFLTKEFELGVRQNVSYFNNDEDTPNSDGNAWGGRTTGIAAFHFDLGALQPYIAGVAGYDYPEGVSGSPVIGPEAGVKYFVNGTTFVFGSVTYYYVTENHSNSFFEANIGVGLRF